MVKKHYFKPQRQKSKTKEIFVESLGCWIRYRALGFDELAKITSKHNDDLSRTYHILEAMLRPLDETFTLEQIKAMEPRELLAISTAIRENENWLCGSQPKSNANTFVA